MKKIISIVLLLTLCFAFVGCEPNVETEKKDKTTTSTEQKDNTDVSTEQKDNTDVSTEQKDNTNVSTEEKNDEVVLTYVPLEVLQTIWASYEEADMFPIAGGDMEQFVMDAPGAFSLKDTENLDYTLGFPASEAEKIDDAASFQHMMNANTFTCGAYHVIDSSNVTTVAESIKNNIAQRQWMCGFPETLLIVSVEDTLVVAFGNDQLIQTFKTKLQTAYPDAEILTEDPIV